MNNTGWTIDQTKELFSLAAAARADGQSLSAAFRVVAQKTSRSVNSVRNYYYSQTKTFELVPEVAAKLGIVAGVPPRERFVPFTAAQTDELIRRVLIAKGRGISVRSAIFELSGGDKKLALRLQNKYRSCLRSHRDTVERIVAELENEHKPCADPYSPKSKLDRITEYIASLEGSNAEKFMALLERLSLG